MPACVSIEWAGGGAPHALEAGSWRALLELAPQTVGSPRIHTGGLGQELIAFRYAAPYTLSSTWLSPTTMSQCTLYFVPPPAHHHHPTAPRPAHRAPAWQRSAQPHHAAERVQQRPPGVAPIDDGVGLGEHGAQWARTRGWSGRSPSSLFSPIAVAPPAPCSLVHRVRHLMPHAVVRDLHRLRSTTHIQLGTQPHSPQARTRPGRPSPPQPSCPARPARPAAPPPV